MAFEVLIAEDAERDIAEIYATVASADSPAKAARLVDALERLCATLAELPERGNIPPELRALGINEYRELHYKPYRPAAQSLRAAGRIIYRVLARQVIVTCVLDARRDMQTLLARRLLR